MTTLRQRHKTKLQQIADQMVATLVNGDELADGRWIHRKLPNGLEIVLQKTGNQRRLALAREDVNPSQHEVSQCYSAFAVPEGTEVSYIKRASYHGKMGRQKLYHVAEMEWIEEPVPA